MTLLVCGVWSRSPQKKGRVRVGTRPKRRAAAFIWGKQPHDAILRLTSGNQIETSRCHDCIRPAMNCRGPAQSETRGQADRRAFPASSLHIVLMWISCLQAARTRRRHDILLEETKP